MTLPSIVENRTERKRMQPWLSGINAAHRGTNMVEVILSTMLVGVVLVASLDSVGSAMRGRHIADSQVDGRLLAESLMAEILAMPYEDPDGTVTVEFGIEQDEVSGPTNRLDFDDIDDYRNWSSTPEKRGGQSISNTSGWTRSVDVRKINFQSATTDLGNGQTDQGVRRITVTVDAPDGTSTELSAIKSSYGSNCQPMGVETTIVTGVNISLTVGASEIATHVNVANHAIGP